MLVEASVEKKDGGCTLIFTTIQCEPYVTGAARVERVASNGDKYEPVYVNLLAKQKRKSNNTSKR